MSENWDLKDLMQAGWTSADLEWEQAVEACALGLANSQPGESSERAGIALQIARETFQAADPRLACALANQALCLAGSDQAAGHKLLAEAQRVWNATAPWIAAMDAPRVARSSLFHMRMEQRHRETYRSNWRVKWQAMAEEAKTRLDACNLDQPVDTAAVSQALERWRRERPAMLNDTRKLMAAAYLTLPGT